MYIQELRHFQYLHFMPAGDTDCILITVRTEPDNFAENAQNIPQHMSIKDNVKPDPKECIF